MSLTAEKTNTGIAWIGVDLDGTLAFYDHWRGVDHIGAPIQTMVTRIRHWLRDGLTVRIFTARVSNENPGLVVRIIQDWLMHECDLPRLRVTNVKDFDMVALWDDRVVQVQMNTGVVLGDTSAMGRDPVC